MYGCAGRAVQLVHVGGLDDAAGVHDRDPVGDVGDDAEVVGDEDQPHAGAPPAAPEQVHDLGLHGDVERRGRLVGDEHAGSRASAIAIMMRWRMPPENWCG